MSYSNPGYDPNAAPVAQQPGAAPVSYQPGAPPPGGAPYPGGPPHPGGFEGVYVNDNNHQQPSGYQGQPPVYQGQPPGYQGQPGQPPQPPGPPPQQIQWMPKPEGIAGCPPGLEYLTSIDQLLVHQQVELLEALTSWETKNRYQIKNSLGQQVYFAQEESDTCMRQCCGSNRGFVMHITDNFGQEVLRVTREFKCCVGCCWCAGSGCCAFEIAVEAPVGNVIGYVRQGCSPWTPKFDILSADREIILSIEGPCCICQGICCTWDQEFKLYTPDKSQEIGKISKQWSGFVKEMFTQADNFGVSFPIDLDVRAKATCIAAVFLIDMMFFQKQDNK